MTMTSPDVELAPSGAYTVDPTHTRIGFVARHAMVTKVRGSFNEFAGNGTFDAADPTKSSLELTIQAKSIDTRNEDRDNHLRSNDFFSMDEYPEIAFRSTSIEALGDTEWAVTGDLTMKGVTKPVTVPFEFTGTSIDPYGNRRIGLEGRASVNRKDWGITWNVALEAGGILVSENIDLEFEVAAVLSDEG